MKNPVKVIRGLMLGCFLATHFTIAGAALMLAGIIFWLFK
jgi:hypothetical protein